MSRLRLGPTAGDLPAEPHVRMAVIGAAGFAGRAILVHRTDYIVDGRLGIGRAREKLGPGGLPFRPGWVCRHDLAEACRLVEEPASPRLPGIDPVAAIA